MKKQLQRSILFVVIAVFVGISCKDNGVSNGGGSTPPDTTSNIEVPIDTTGQLKDATDIPVGVGIDYSLMLNNQTYAATVKQEFNNITAQYIMKQAVIVQDNGNFDYSTPDNLVQIAENNGLNVHAHTLIWYQNNNGNYLRSLVNNSGGGNPNDGPNILENGGFENWSGSAPDGWTVLNNTNGNFEKEIQSSNVQSGDNALKVQIDSSAKNYQTQIHSSSFSTKKGETYRVDFWIKASTSGAQYQIEGRSATVNYSGNKDTPTSYTMETYSFSADSTTSSITFDMGHSPAGITYIDDVTIVNISENSGNGGTHAQDSTVIADFMKKYITQTVSHYKGKVKSWDVVNEPIEDGTGKIRTNPSQGSPTTGGTFYWDEFIGDSYIPVAFRYAHQADPDVKLFINEYNLAIDNTKRQTLINLVNEMKSNNVPIDGIGAQMHISIKTSHSDIDQAFKQLAATGLLVRVSELDVRINPDNETNFSPTAELLVDQQLMYNYVVWSYLQNVPKNQQAGVTVWNLIDNNSWIVKSQGHDDYPTLFDSSYKKKRAYSGMKRGLEGISPDDISSK